MAVSTATLADRIREYVREKFVMPARSSGKQRFLVRAGDVHRALRLFNRMPAVCSALRQRQFLHDNGLKIVEQSGPPSGASSTVTITYELTSWANRPPSRENAISDFLAMQGALRDVFQALGGGERFLREERAAWDDDVQS